MDDSAVSNSDPKADPRGDSVHDRLNVGRFVFALPDPLPFPDLTEIFEKVGNEPGEHRPDDPWVHLCFHQIEGPGGAEVQRLRALTEVVDSIAIAESDSGSSDDDGVSASEPLFTTTIVEACTSQVSPDPPPAGAMGIPQDQSPRSDAFMRCLRLVDDLARAYRIATKVPIGPVTYERVSPFVFLFMGEVPWWMDGTEMHIDFTNASWAGPSLMMLNHLNLSSLAVGPPVIDEIAMHTRYWHVELSLGGQMSGWREHLVSARRATEIQGDHGAAVVLAQTGGEMFLDMLLGLLMWEEGADPAEVAPLFAEGEITRRVKSEFAPRLGGTWKLDGKGPVATWFHQAARLRHRVVHGGYRPTRAEAAQAIQSVYDLQTYAFDRLCERRNTYSRATLMTLAQPGLERRGVWSGKIKTFAERQAPSEPNWRISFGTWHNQLVEAAAPAP